MEDFYKRHGLHTVKKPDDFNEGIILLFNKPFKWSSFDVVNKARYLIRQLIDFKKIKVGHAGTLDTLATGLMIVCTGKLTKQIDNLMGMDKEYVASIAFGSATPSYDLETQADQFFDIDHIDEQKMDIAIKSFLGKQMQTPPLFSAIQINGKRAYEHARKGHDVELSQREVDFKELELLSYNKPVAVVRIVCSKGTYIRSFANDLGLVLKSGAHLSALERTAIGPFSISEAQSIEQFEIFLQKFRTN